MYTICQLLNEGRVEDAKKKYPNVNVDQLVYFDHSPTKKYVMWMAKQRSNGHRVEDIAPTVNEFDRVGRNLQKKSIDQYEDLKELEDALKEYDFKKSANKREKMSHQDAEFIAEDSGYLLYHIKTHSASCELGRGTKWCITMSNPDFWNAYNESGSVFYFCIPTSANDKKFALQISTDYKITSVLKPMSIAMKKIECWASDDRKVKLPANLINLSKIASDHAKRIVSQKSLPEQLVGIFPLNEKTYTLETVKNVIEYFRLYQNKDVVKNMLNKESLKFYNDKVAPTMSQSELKEADEYFIYEWYMAIGINLIITAADKRFNFAALPHHSQLSVTYKIPSTAYNADITILTNTYTAFMIYAALSSRKLPEEDEIKKIYFRIAQYEGHNKKDLINTAEKAVHDMKNSLFTLKHE